MKDEIKILEEEKKELNNNPPIKTFSLGDEFHPILPNDEIIEFIGERIRALENLENCFCLKVLFLIKKRNYC
jgi:hypothetical protein